MKTVNSELGKARIELLVAVLPRSLIKFNIFVVHKFHGFPKFTKIELLEIKGYKVARPVQIAHRATLLNSKHAFIG